MAYSPTVFTKPGQSDQIAYTPGEAVQLRFDGWLPLGEAPTPLPGLTPRVEALEASDEAQDLLIEGFVESLEGIIAEATSPALLDAPVAANIADVGSDTNTTVIGLIEGKVGEAIDAQLLTYQGAWDPSANTPTLVDGVGAAGDYYQASDAATINLGSGDLPFETGDYVQYDGAVWSRVPVTGAAVPDTGWITPTFINGFANLGSGFAVAQYRKTGTEGRVTVRGAVTSGTNGAACFNLPAGFRPAAHEMFIAWSDQGASLLTMKSDGDLTITSGGGGTIGVYCSICFSFIAEQ